MSSKDKNLSAYSPGEIPGAEGFRIGIVVSAWNTEITSSLLKAASDTLKLHGVDENDIISFEVPGSFELPLGASWLLERNEDLDAVICLGCVIRGETRHFDFICQGVTQGIMDLNLRFGKPVIFGVLTTENHQQAIDRAGGRYGNKGTEAALTAINMIAQKRNLE